MKAINDHLHMEDLGTKLVNARISLPYVQCSAEQDGVCLIVT